MKILLLQISGVLLATGDFLFACTYSHLPFSVAFPIYGAWGLVEGTVLNYVGSSSETVNPPALFVGVFCAVLAIFFMAASDYFSNSAQIMCDNKCSGHEEVIETASSSDIVIEEPPLPVLRIWDCMQFLNPYIGMCLLAGVSTGLWSPLSAYARGGDGGVNNPYVALFLFMSGQVLALPLLLAGQVYLQSDRVDMIVYEDNVRDQSETTEALDSIPSQDGGCQLLAAGHVYSNSSGAPLLPPQACGGWLCIFQVCNGVVKCMKESMDLPLRDKLFGMLAGIIVGVGYTCLFVASESATTTVAFAIACCDPLVAISIGVLFFGQLRHASFKQGAALCAAVVMFTTAIILFVFSM